ncbi:D-2-hydroxyacid dehydrogenase [Bradyrhizobium niftali]|uniref:D-2-hydroxyacid dehydrogenase n=1 Tax=Bradyrhizobium niftali TaxID=2560055 RepID=A0A4Y9L0X2_9BRAD|nr:D-2-hydroxyacid dehydrogenase [Bradyrhizobium niftali]TFV35874.1 D-2-hydroxyacid dehydrogenase [Bradyrhizobium niftali]
MAVQGSAMTMVVNHASAESFVRLIEERFPQVRTIAALNVDQLEQHIAEADALLGSSFPVDLVDQAKKLRWFQSTSVGIDSMLPIRHKVSHMIVTNARSVQGEIIADYVMAGATMLHWDFRRYLRDQAERKWAPRMVAPLGDKTLGIVGLGSIGTTIARRAKSAGMTVVGSRRDPSQTAEGVDRVFGSHELKEMLPLCDFVVLAVPATTETIGLIGAAEIANMRREAFLINIARGNVVVEDELISALRSGAIAGAMLDVFEREPLSANSPLWDMQNVIATPHVSGVPTNYAKRVFPIVEENINRFLNGQTLKNVVDLERGY